MSGHSKARNDKRRKCKRAKRNAETTAKATITLASLQAEYAWNDHRQLLFQKLLQEIESIRQNTRRFTVYLFGGYLGRKEAPKDIDLLVAFQADMATMLRNRGRLPRVHPDFIDMATWGGTTLLNKQQIVRAFNTQESNLANNIRLTRRQLRELRL